VLAACCWPGHTGWAGGCRLRGLSLPGPGGCRWWRWCRDGYGDEWGGCCSCGQHLLPGGALRGGCDCSLGEAACGQAWQRQAALRRGRSSAKPLPAGRRGGLGPAARRPLRPRPLPALGRLRAGCQAAGRAAPQRRRPHAAGGAAPARRERAPAGGGEHANCDEPRYVKLQTSWHLASSTCRRRGNKGVEELPHVLLAGAGTPGRRVLGAAGAAACSCRARCRSQPQRRRVQPCEAGWHQGMGPPGAALALSRSNGRKPPPPGLIQHNHPLGKEASARAHWRAALSLLAAWGRVRAGDRAKAARGGLCSSTLTCSAELRMRAMNGPLAALAAAVLLQSTLVALRSAYTSAPPPCMHKPWLMSDSNCLLASHSTSPSLLRASRSRPHGSDLATCGGPGCALRADGKSSPARELGAQYDLRPHLGARGVKQRRGEDPACWRAGLQRGVLDSAAVQVLRICNCRPRLPR
jgi:hypothetical protein